MMLEVFVFIADMDFGGNFAPRSMVYNAPGTH